jgi:hypothetical protein
LGGCSVHAISFAMNDKLLPDKKPATESQRTQSRKGLFCC